MHKKGSNGWSRREFITTLGIAGGAALLGSQSDILAAEPPPETTRLRLLQLRSICNAPQYVAEESLQREGFTDVRYARVEGPLGVHKALAAGQADINMGFVAPFIVQVDVGDPIVMLAGVHIGCFELFGTERVRTIRDLKGKKVAVPDLGSGPHVFVASMAAHVGLDPRKEINWVTHPTAEAKALLAEGKIDAYLGFPPDPQELREKGISRVVVNGMMDRPWSQYFCCMIVGNREFVRKHPVATKRAIRAILKGTDVCAHEPQRVARFLVDKGYTANYKHALQTMEEMKMAYHGKWRQYEPEDTVRFYALRLHEAGMIKASPQKIIAQGTDWRFLRELKKELKG
jgi:NitT/TauT family transport system substrate-binding protein